ncbi:MAG: hypothetical protein C5B49_13875, partial [Bdellovibrio sp.]
MGREAGWWIAVAPPLTQPAVFFDRDGVLVEYVEYLSRLEQMRIRPCAGAAFSRLKSAGFLTVVVTNQPMVARGQLKEKDLLQMHHWLERQLKSQGEAWDEIYYCPHTPPPLVTRGGSAAHAPPGYDAQYVRECD